MGQNKTKICCKNIKIFPEILDNNSLHLNKNCHQPQNNSEILHEEILNDEIFNKFKNIEYDNRRDSLNLVVINGKTYVKEGDNMTNRTFSNYVSNLPKIPDPNHDIYYGAGYKNV